MDKDIDSADKVPFFGRLNWNFINNVFGVNAYQAQAVFSHHLVNLNHQLHRIGAGGNHFVYPVHIILGNGVITP